jgi:hypothetical protein
MVMRLLNLTLLCALLVAAGGCSGAYVPPAAPAETVRESVPATGTPAVVEPLPTMTSIPLLTATNTHAAPLPLSPTPKMDAILQGDRVQFPPGGTWVEFTGYLDQGSPKTYVLAAMGGQVMSVSVRQGWPFTVTVADDVRMLTDPNYARPFWRGVLPATQDYFVRLDTDASGEYTLRIAINPPGQALQYFDYVDARHGSSLRYSDEFVPTLYSPAGGDGGGFLLTLMFINMEFLTPVTNLIEAMFVYSAMDDEERVATCTEPLSPQESMLGQVIINGYEFTRSEKIGAGVGNIYDQVIYRTVIENVCYEMLLSMHSGNIGNYAPGTVVEFDRDALLAKFEAILASFEAG